MQRKQRICNLYSDAVIMTRYEDNHCPGYFEPAFAPLQIESHLSAIFIYTVEIVQMRPEIVLSSSLGSVSVGKNSDCTKGKIVAD